MNTAEYRSYQEPNNSGMLKTVLLSEKQTRKAEVQESIKSSYSNKLA